MRVGDAEKLQRALDAAVLAEPAVQRIEGDVGFERREHIRDVMAGVDAAHSEPLLF